MTLHYQAATLVASPSYPNSIAWSNENLVAVASGRLITILNPAILGGPRGLIILRPSDPFPIGVVDREDLYKPCLMPTCLSRDTDPCARSISWSHPGFAPNSSCLLAVCTVDGRVKLYRSPVCEFCDEWIEVVDISHLLYKYFESRKFGEVDGPELSPQKQVNADCTQETGCIGEWQESLSCKGPGRRKRKETRVESYVYDEYEQVSATLKEDSSSCNVVDRAGGVKNAKGSDFSFIPCSVSKTKSAKKIVKPGLEIVVKNGRSGSPKFGATSSGNGENNALPLITAKQYASRSALLSSLIVAWSPVVPSCGTSPCLSKNWCILSVGSKSGNVYLWKICKPECYTIEAGVVSTDPMLIGILQAHNSWVSAISWGVSAASSSESLLVLVTGSSDGSVKIWLGDLERLNQCTEAKEVPFSLLAEVTAVTSAPVSTISLAVPAQPQDEVTLAIGRGSGSLETWICSISGNKIQNTGVYNAHDQVVTGLAWSFDGHCLYSCSQDNSVRCWVFNKNHLEEVPVHSKFPGLKESTDLSEVSDRCFGLALAPGELMVAVVRSLDANLLNQMYQARTQKAVVEFIWAGGQFLGIPLEKSIPICGEQLSVLSESDFMWWGSNILWVLKNYENGGKGLVLWDVVTALLAFKKSAPTFVEALIHKWVSILLSDNRQSVSVDMLSHIKDMLSKVSSRKLHLLNIICRKLVVTNQVQQYPGDVKNDDITNDLWNSLLVSSERELRERLVAFTFTAVLNRAAHLLENSSVESSWFPVGVAQMICWVSMSDGEMHNQLKALTSKIRDLGSRINSACEYVTDEACAYCSAPVQFESPEVAWCRGENLPTASTERHKLSRCAVSMRLCSILEPKWHCVCCHRVVDKLAPEIFFTMPRSPLDVNRDFDGSLDPSAPPVALCPFCGILLQRSMPEFLLSISPV